MRSKKRAGYKNVTNSVTLFEKDDESFLLNNNATPIIQN